MSEPADSEAVVSLSTLSTDDISLWERLGMLEFALPTQLRHRIERADG